MKHELIHVNIALAKYPLNSDQMLSFWSLERPIMELATAQPGFIRNIEFPDRFSVFPDPHVVNATAWNDVDQLKRFVYTGLHSEALKNRKRWFTESQYPTYCLFWSEPDAQHTEKSLAEKIFAYAKHGATKDVFDFKSIHPPAAVDYA